MAGFQPSTNGRFWVSTEVYAVTAAGRRHLATEKRDLDRMVSIIDALFQEPA